MANHVAENPRNMSTSGRATLTRGRGEEEGSAPECKLPPELDQGLVQQWNDFMTGPLAEINKKNDTNLVRERATLKLKSRHHCTLSVIISSLH